MKCNNALREKQEEWIRRPKKHDLYFMDGPFMLVDPLYLQLTES